MPSQQAAPDLVRFGLFEADLETRELRKQDRTIKLQEQPFQLLALLLLRPGEVVAREELQAALWPADTFVEFDQALNTAIKKIRVALGDSADNPRFIQTLPRKGYRFIAPIDRPQTEVVPPPAPKRTHHVYWFIGVFVLAVGAGTAGSWLYSTRPAAKPYIPIPLTSYPGSQLSPSFSPDGNQVAFSWSSPANHTRHIYSKLIGTDEPVQLTQGDAEDYAPAWSPDSRIVAFLRRSPDHRSGLFVVPAPGGPARKLAELWSPGDSEPPYVSWHPNGKALVIVDKEAPDQSFALFLLSLDTGEKRRLTTPPPGRRDVGPAVSPDGRAIVFSRAGRDLFLLELTNSVQPKGPPVQLTFENRYTASPAWTPDGRAIVFSSGSPHSPTLYRISVSRTGWKAGKPERLSFTGDGARQPAISRRGRLGYVRFTIDANIWRMRLKGESPPELPPAKLIASRELDHQPQYSPDGTRIAFASNRSGSHEIWLCKSDGSGTIQLTSFGGFTYTAGPRWSPDGRQIFFGSEEAARLKPFVISSDGGRPRRVEIGPTDWSHDGKWIYFGSSSGRRPEVFKMPVRGGPAIQITHQGGSGPQESRDGQTLYYMKGGDEFTSLWKVPVEGGAETKVLESVCCQNFAVVEQGIYFIPAPSGGHSSLHFFSFRTGEQTAIAQLSGFSAYGLSVSPDRHWLLYSQYEPKGADLMTVEDFR